MIELDVLSAADRAADEDAQATEGQAPTWRSRAGLAGTLDPSVARDEFLPDAMGDGDVGPSRRTFLKVMGASAALAGVTGCRRPVETILPYARKPEDVIPGVPSYYATAMPLGGVAFPVLVQSHEGRPTKVEGNPEHPISQGASGAFAQASVLQLYDPDRSRYVTSRSGDVAGRTDWEAFVAEASRLRLRSGGQRVAVLAGPSASPTTDALRTQFEAAYPGTRWITLGAHLEDAQALGTQQALGQPARPLYRFEGADVIVSLDADFLGAEDANEVWNSRQYAASRRVDERGSMSRPLRRRVHDDHDGRHGGSPRRRQGRLGPVRGRRHRPRSRRRGRRSRSGVRGAHAVHRGRRRGRARCQRPRRLCRGSDAAC